MRNSIPPDPHADIFDAQAQWILDREIAKNTGHRMFIWERKNPSPFLKNNITDFDGEILRQTDKYREEIEVILKSVSPKYRRESELKKNSVDNAVTEEGGDHEGCAGIEALSKRYIDTPLGVDSKTLRINDSGTGVMDYHSKNVYNNDQLGKSIMVEAGVLNALYRIRANKDKLKKKADESTSHEELTNIAILMRKLVAEERRYLFKYDFPAFDDYLFQDLQDRVDTAEFHFEMFKLYELSKRSCVICPRGHAKTTTARKYLLHQILNRKETYIVIVGATEAMAAQTLRWIRDQFTENDRLIDVYGNMANRNKWADTEFEVQAKDNDGKVVYSCKVVAKGAGQKIRGANERGRPTLFYIDDLEDDEQVESIERREKLAQWIVDAMMPSGSKGVRFIITGTILHTDSLLINIALNKVGDHIPWDVLFYSAIYSLETPVTPDNERALWEDHQSLEKLRILRGKNELSFSKEYQNNPRSGSAGVFKSSSYKYYEPADLHIDRGVVTVLTLPRYKNILTVMVHTDFAYAAKKSSDYVVYMATGMDYMGNLYVLDYLRFKEKDPYVQIDLLFDFCNRWGSSTITMEDQAYQYVLRRVLDREMKERDRVLYIIELNRSDATKLLRIKSLAAPVVMGQILWTQSHTELEKELDDVTASSLGRHDDIIDCLADGWKVQTESRVEEPDDEPEANTYAWFIKQGIWEEDEERIRNARR
jgi:hypothetical protein